MGDAAPVEEEKPAENNDDDEDPSVMFGKKKKKKAADAAEEKKEEAPPTEGWRERLEREKKEKKEKKDKKDKEEEARPPIQAVTDCLCMGEVVGLRPIPKKDKVHVCEMNVGKNCVIDVVTNVLDIEKG